MSIAVSAVVRPSRMLLVMVGCMSLLAIVTGLSAGVGALGELSSGVRWSLAALSVFLGVFGFYHYLRQRKILHITISGSGRIYVGEASSAGDTCMNGDWPHVGKDGRAMRLRDDSTIWPTILLLRFQDDEGNVLTVPVLPDCVSSDEFRGLSLACRWIAARTRVPEQGSENLLE